jgi:hypothetical protein
MSSGLGVGDNRVEGGGIWRGQALSAASKAASSRAHKLHRAGTNLAFAHAALMEMNPRPNTASLEALQKQIREQFNLGATYGGWDANLILSCREDMA